MTPTYRDYPLLQKFVDYVYMNHDSPIEYHILDGLSMAALFMKPWYFAVGESRERLNLWTLVLDYSANNHKSTILGYALKFVRTINKNLIMGSDFSAEALFNMLKTEVKETGTKIFDPKV